MTAHCAGRSILLNSIAGDDTITFDTTVFSSPQIINLTGVLPDLSSNIVIDGPGAKLTTSNDTGGNYRIFFVASGAIVTIDGLTLANALGSGGAAANSGTLTINNSTISGNSATFGGGVSNTGTMFIFNSTLSGNSASNRGGGVYNAGSGALTITNRRTISGNSASIGGGVASSGSSALTVTITNSTLADNTATTLADSIHHSSGTITIQNTIIVGGTCLATITDGGGNLAYPTACDSISAGGNPMLGALADNGGPTLTHLPAFGSAAIDAGDDSICAASPVNNVDQRGVARPFDGNGDSLAHCDIGAVEVNTAPPTSTPTSTSTPTETGTPTSTATSTSTPTATDTYRDAN
ncbi:MAG: right-handed parallel beta-helix repeat-containing protein [Anaerolineae bacterium]